MKLFVGFLWGIFVLSRCRAAPAHSDVVMTDQAEEHPEESHYDVTLDRCGGIEFDAIAPDEKGNIFFFKGDHLWKGFSGPPELANGTFQELDEYHHLGHVDAAFRMHNKDEYDPKGHDHMFFFLKEKVFSYYQHALEKGFPVDIRQIFPGIPSFIDAAVECPKGECTTDSILFFKGRDVYSFDIKTKTVKQKVWTHLPNCTSVLRWVEHYYCFHGTNFTRFHPVSGEVSGVYPKDARRYFMSCPNFGHGEAHRKPRCKLDAITTDITGKSYAFTGSLYIRLDKPHDGSHHFPITRSWKEVSGPVDAVFSFGDKMYIIQESQVYIYKSAAHYTLIEGYPKSVREELGVDGPVDAAFVCADEHVAHIIQGQKMIDIDLAATPRAVKSETSLPVGKVDAATCDSEGVKLFVGPEFFLYQSPKVLAVSKISPEAQKIPPGVFGCEHKET
ncbi:hemopexin [Brachyhypopomus gauderio]|uniref:hemopexin n=1 Tax=Brachyhypopomus gauderio TaxID=698409 RepID=UPI0040436046